MAIKYPKIIAVETIKHASGEQSNSYRVQFNKNMILWFDTERDENGELTGDWNKYIFFDTDEQDQKDKAFQDANSDEAGAYNYMTAIELCEQYELNLLSKCDGKHKNVTELYNCPSCSILLNK